MDLDHGQSAQHGPGYLIYDEGQLSVVSAAKGGAHGPPTSSGGGGGGGTTTPVPTGSPASTLVGASTGLEINLMWDDSVRTAANWSDIENAVVSAAQIYTSN